MSTKAIAWSDKNYDEKTKLLTETKHKYFVDESGEIISEETETHDLFYGDGGFWKVYLRELLRVLGKFSDNRVKVLCFICENTSKKNNVFTGTVDVIARYTGLSRSTVIRSLNLLKEADFLKMISHGQYMLNPKIMCVGGGRKDPAKQSRLIAQYNGISETEGRINHVHYSAESIKQNKGEKHENGNK